MMEMELLRSKKYTFIYNITLMWREGPDQSLQWNMDSMIWLELHLPSPPWTNVCSYDASWNQFHQSKRAHVEEVTHSRYFWCGKPLTSIMKRWSCAILFVRVRTNLGTGPMKRDDESARAANASMNFPICVNHLKLQFTTSIHVPFSAMLVEMFQ